MEPSGSSRAKVECTRCQGIDEGTSRRREILLSGDGRFLDDSGENLWLEYMKGLSISQLAKLIDRRLDA